MQLFNCKKNIKSLVFLLCCFFLIVPVHAGWHDIASIEKLRNCARLYKQDQKSCSLPVAIGCIYKNGWDSKDPFGDSCGPLVSEKFNDEIERKKVNDRIDELVKMVYEFLDWDDALIRKLYLDSGRKDWMKYSLGRLGIYSDPVNSDLFAAVRPYNYKSVPVLIEKCADASCKQLPGGFTFLQKVQPCTDLVSIKNTIETLLANGANKELFDERGFTPLMCATYFLNLPAVYILLKNGVDVSKRSLRGCMTALDLLREGACLTSLQEENVKFAARLRESNSQDILEKHVLMIEKLLRGKYTPEEFDALGRELFGE
ncbi:TPA: hypothetical protein DEO28_03415 [Candidatus Dependentiae bacterium]|nr:MAG: hypothetical protein UR43_C0004G0196 [candidate division TM6 bacterium GW2011_GWF2_33_332]HBS48106.1 hypothetical protein [Candidatus Dependentiae bacterium]HBZ73530.1 hypothetical protein [Candidatus Dependentiae bacterium]